MSKGAVCLSDGEMVYDNSSRIEPKFSHQWFMDGHETDLFPNKKQAVGVPTTNLLSGMLTSNVSPCANVYGFHSISGQFEDTETAQAVNYGDRSIPSVSTEKVDLGRKVSEDFFTNDSSLGLSMSHTLEDRRSGLNYGGIRKVKASLVKDCENLMSVSMGHAYDLVDNNSASTCHADIKMEDGKSSVGLIYNEGDENMSIGDTYERGNIVFMSMGQSYNKSEDSVTVGQTYKESNNGISVCNTFNKRDNNFMSMVQTYNKKDDNSVTLGPTYSKGDGCAVSITHSSNKVDNNNLSVGQSYSKGESIIISFGGCDDDDTNPSGRLIAGYDLLMGQPSVQRPDALNEKELVKSNATVPVSTSNLTASGGEIYRRKEGPETSKKVPSNNFPSNVRSLLSTGMLDGVPVTYIAWSREKKLRGVIKSSGYQCGCQACNFSKVINAYEFERHAGCKTKHPNNHIYFENGKTIYGIVQELRSTPQNMLFDTILTITGSPINQKSFRLWKESFVAATRELQRIYGKDEVKPLS
ncbi:hypothetical protein DITRI_Ditri06bG0070600 [Diplodiscus trichospermus]